MAFEIIIGGGPIGCYLAFKLLNANPNSQVIMFETRQFDRPQVIRIPFDIANDLPQAVKNEMWYDAKTRSRIFDPGYATNSHFWPKPGYPYWPFISIRSFQKTMISLLLTNPSYKDRFYFVCYDGKSNLDNWDESIKRSYPQFTGSIKNSIHAIYCTCGISAKLMREELNLQGGKSAENKGDGIYLIYQNYLPEHYLRNAIEMSSQNLANNGITYAATNNRHLDVQLYTYPVGQLAEIFSYIPEEFMNKSSYNNDRNVMTMTGEGLSSTTLDWFEKYKNTILKIAKQFEINLPNSNQIKIFYANRSEYYWDIVAVNTSFHEYNCPVFFIGDSAGSTDYKSGLSMGRGLLSAKILSSLMIQFDDMTKIISSFQDYWKTIIDREFNQDASLLSDPWIQYQYLIKGRQVIFNDKMIHYKDDDQYAQYHEQCI